MSFGTVASPRPDELRELAAGLEASGAPFLWSLREDSWPLLPSGFLDRATSTGSGLVVPWAPRRALGSIFFAIAVGAGSIFYEKNRCEGLNENYMSY